MSVLDIDNSSRAECRTEDMFRRATFAWAQSTRKMVESSIALGSNTKVSLSALADIQYARDLLENLYIPKVLRTSTRPEGESLITAAEVQASASSLATRIVLSSMFPAVDEPSVQERRGVDLSAPVISKNGKMLWATIDCPACPSKATQRCQKGDGGFIEKPHRERKTVSEQGQTH